MKKLLKIFWQLFSSSVMAGVCIGVAGLQYLRLFPTYPLLGAVLFSLGLVIVVRYGFQLYTGTAGFATSKGDWFKLPLILLGNVVGCWLVSKGALVSLPGISDLSLSVISSRIPLSSWQAGLLGVGCGFLMTAAVSGLKGWVVKDSRTWIPLFFCVPGFIICGFLHSVADSFYYLCLPADYFTQNFPTILRLWLSVVLGNLVGCNLPRLITLSYWKL